MKNQIMYTDKGAEIKTHILERYLNEDHSKLQLVIEAYIKNKDSVFRPYRRVGYLSSFFSPRYSFSGIQDKFTNVCSYDYDLKKINELDYVGSPYSYLSLIRVDSEENNKGIGSALLDLQDYFFAKYCDENNHVFYNEVHQPMIRGLFFPDDIYPRAIVANFYRKNGFEFVKSKEDLFKTIDVKETLENTDSQIKDLYYKERDCSHIL